MVNARCFRQLSFMTLDTIGDDIYRVVVSESKLSPTRLILGLWNYSGIKMLLLNPSTMFNGLTDGCGLGGTPNS
jgi:hypothetical protein